MTDGERMKEEKVKLQAAIHSAVSAAVREFKESTGLTPCDITINMVPVDLIGLRAADHIVGDVRVRVEL